MVNNTVNNIRNDRMNKNSSMKVIAMKIDTDIKIVIHYIDIECMETVFFWMLNANSKWTGQTTQTELPLAVLTMPRSTPPLPLKATGHGDDTLTNGTQLRVLATKGKQGHPSEEFIAKVSPLR